MNAPASHEELNKLTKWGLTIHALRFTERARTKGFDSFISSSALGSEHDLCPCQPLNKYDILPL